MLRKFFVALEGVEQRLMVDAELSGGLAEREAVGHEAEKAALGHVVELNGAPAADGAGGNEISGGLWWAGGNWRCLVPPYGLRQFFAEGRGRVANYSGLLGGLSGDFIAGSDGYNQNAIKRL